MLQQSPPGFETIRQQNILQTQDENVLLHSSKSQGRQLPIPKGDSPYCLAKRAEYLEKDLQKAQSYYELSIKIKDRLPSAVKDLAGVLHQQGQTKQAVDLLEQHKHVFKNDMKKLDNLLNSLKKQVQPTGNAANKCVRISNYYKTLQELIDMFQSGDKIITIDVNQKTNVAKVQFNSHSSARKAMDSFKGWENKQFKIEWTTVTGKVTGNVIPPKKAKQREISKTQNLCQQSSLEAKFSYLFAFQIKMLPYLVPVDESDAVCDDHLDDPNEVFQELKFLGYDLMAFIDSPELLSLPKKQCFVQAE